MSKSRTVGKMGVGHSCLVFLMILILGVGCGGVDSTSFEENGKAEKVTLKGYAIDVEQDGNNFSIKATPLDSTKAPLHVTRLEDGTLIFDLVEVSFSVDSDGNLDQEIIDNAEKIKDDLPLIAEAANALITEMMKLAEEPTVKIEDYPFQGLEYNYYDGMEYEAMKKSAIGLAVGLGIAVASYAVAELLAVKLSADLIAFENATAALVDLQKAAQLSGGWNGLQGILKACQTILVNTQHAPTVVKASKTISAVVLFIGEALWLTEDFYPASDSVAVGACDSVSCIFNELPLSSDIDALP